ncbi:unnamed protein product [Auanema sp. JU1783]|nr:unnamed protein product [Auanema sp. JU1783]
MSETNPPPVRVKGPKIKLENGDEIIYIDHIKREDLCASEDKRLRLPPCPQPPEGFEMIDSAYAKKYFRMIFWSDRNFKSYIRGFMENSKGATPLSAQQTDLLFNPKYHGSYVIMRSYGTFLKCTLITARYSQNSEKSSKTIAIMVHKEQDEESYSVLGKLVAAKYANIAPLLGNPKVFLDIIYRINSPVRILIQKTDFFRGCNSIPVTNDVYDQIVSDIPEDGIDLTTLRTGPLSG